MGADSTKVALVDGKDAANLKPVSRRDDGCVGQAEVESSILIHEIA